MIIGDQLLHASIQEKLLLSVPFELLYEDGDDLIVFDKGTCSHDRITGNSFIERYLTFLKRIIGVYEGVTKAIAVQGGVVFHIVRGLGKLAEEELLFLAWKKLLINDAHTILESALNKVNDIKEPIFVYPIQPRPRFRAPKKTVMVCFQEEMVIFSKVEDVAEDLHHVPANEDRFHEY